MQLITENLLNGPTLVDVRTFNCYEHGQIADYIAPCEPYTIHLRMSMKNETQPIEIQDNGPDGDSTSEQHGLVSSKDTVAFSEGEQESPSVQSSRDQGSITYLDIEWV